MSALRERVERALGDAYTVERELSGGGMSCVLLATDTALGRPVVMKVLPPELAASVSVERFRREIMLAAGLQHPHIVGVLSAGEIDGLPYFIMPYVAGESLRARLQRGRLAIPEAVRILRDVARALAYAHERGIVHRDIKPDNVLLAAGAACVADFGVAKAIAASSGAPPERAERARELSGRAGARSGDEAAARTGTLTQFGISLGTPAYMAPEQVAADPAMDHRADLYAFGVMAYELLAGTLPFQGATPQALLAAQLTETPAPLGVHRGDVPRALAAIVMRCLEKDPARRPLHGEALVAALDDPATISGAFLSAPFFGGVRWRLAAWRRHRLLLPAIGLALAGAFAVGMALRAHAGAGAAPSERGVGVAAAALPDARSVAVLPMVNIGRDTSDRYFAEGMTEEITSKLAQLPGVRVASRTAAEATRGMSAGVAELGKRLNVATLLEGTVQRDGKRLRLTARLINVADGYTLWSDVFESEVTDVFAVQDEISRSIADALGEELAAGERAAGSAHGRAPGHVAATPWARAAARRRGTA